MHKGEGFCPLGPSLESLEKTGLERLGMLPKVIQLVSGRTRI